MAKNIVPARAVRKASELERVVAKAELRGARGAAEARAFLQKLEAPGAAKLPPATLSGSSLDGEAHQRRKQERDRERQKYRARKSRAKIERAADGRILDPSAKAFVPSAKTFDRLLGEDYVFPDAAFAEMISKLRWVLRDAKCGFDPAGLPGSLGGELAKHAGKVSRDTVERVRAMCVAAGIVPPDEEWERWLRVGFHNALRSRNGDPSMKVWNKEQIQRFSVACGPSGTTIRAWLQAVCDYVPPSLTPGEIERALNRSSLGRGGSAKKLVNWKKSVADLIRRTREMPHSLQRPP